MKELSIEQKAQRYDEAIAHAKKLLKTIGNATLGNLVLKNEFEIMFPELAESEDEEIRKEMLQIAKESEDSFYMVMTPNKRERLIAWLEKQGEKNLADKVKSKFKVGDWIVYKDTVWKVCNIPLQNYYELLSINNEVIIRHFEGVDNTAHLWTIQDAKDGDVLVCKGDIKNSNGIKYERICLFKNLGNAFFTLTKTSNYVEEYGFDVNIDYPDNTVLATKEQKEILFMAMKEAGYEWDAEKKELKKIADKVESKFHKGDWITDGISKCQIRFIDDAQYYYSENCILGSIESVDKRYHLWTIQDAKDGDVLASKDGDDILIFRKLDGNKSFSSYYNIRGRKEIGWHNGWCYGSFIPATKEQCDVLMKAMTEAGYIFDFEKKELKRIEHNLAENSTNVSESSIEEKDMGEYKKGFECGKQRVLKYPEDFGLCKKSAWSEEDAYNHHIILALLNNECVGCADKRTAIDWFNSLKDRYTWKPSEGQMEFLKKCIEAYNEVTFPTEVRVLSSLYNDLKKLME